MGAQKPNCCGTLSWCHTIHGVLGILGTLTLIISAVTPQWYNNRGLWESQESSGAGSVIRTRAYEAQFLFFGSSVITATASFCICLIFLFCWKAPEYSQDDLQVPSPAKLFLTILLITGFLFSVGWTIFTCQHLEDIQRCWTCLGYSYWLGVVIQM